MNNITVIGYINREPVPMGENGCYGVVTVPTSQKTEDKKTKYVFFLFQAHNSTAKYLLEWIKKDDRVVMTGEVIQSFRDPKEKVLRVLSCSKLGNMQSDPEPPRKPEPILDKEPFLGAEPVLIDVEPSWDDVPY
jgi:hypothetical protein